MSSTTDYIDCPNCGSTANITQDNNTCEITRSCCNCDWTGEEAKEVQDYTVTYEIDISAKSPLQAAKQAYQNMLNSQYKPFLVVKNKDGKETEIDLETI